MTSISNTIVPPVLRTDSIAEAGDLLFDFASVELNIGNDAAYPDVQDNYQLSFQLHPDGGVTGKPQTFLCRHSCNTFNSAVVGNKLIALKNLSANEELKVNCNQFLFNIESNKQFSCTCHGDVIKGYKHLTIDARRHLTPLLDEELRITTLTSNSFNNLIELAPPSPMVEVVALDVNSPTNTSASTQLQVIATSPIAQGATIWTCHGLILPFAMPSTVAISHDRHVRLMGEAEYLWHSCNPNVRFVVRPDNSLGIVALRNIHPNEPLRYNYCSTEWAMDKAFQCECGSENCLKSVQGFQYLAEDQQKSLWNQVTPAIRHHYRSNLSPTRDQPARASSSTVLVELNPFGEVTVEAPVEEGSILLFPLKTEVKGRALVCDNVHIIPHGCDANVVLVEGRIVARHHLAPGDKLFINLSLIHWELKEPFTCECGGCIKEITGFKGLSHTEKSQNMHMAEPEVRRAFTENGLEIFSASTYMEVRPNGEMGEATFARSDISAGTWVFSGRGLVIPFPTMYTICLREGRHLLFADGGQCLAHSCDPNVKIVVEESCFHCVALRPIKEGELIAFNYLTTEYEMNTPFDCLCGAEKCFGKIQGFCNVAQDRMVELSALCTPPVLMMARDVLSKQH